MGFILFGGFGAQSLTIASPRTIPIALVAWTKLRWRCKLRAPMKRIISRLCLPALALLLAAGSLPGEEAVTRAAIQPVALGELRWTHGFWAQRYDECRDEMIPAMGVLMSGTNHTQFLRNFEIAAGLATGRSRGAAFNDGDFYKWIEAASATLAVTKNPALVKQLDAIIAVIAQAQRTNGYLHTPVLIGARNGDTNAVPFRDRNNFEMYNLGHLFTAASVHHRVTGQTNFLAVAIRAADFLCATFSNSPPEVARSSVCPSHFMGLVDLSRETGDPRYLALAEKIFSERSLVTDGGDDNQDRIPFAQQTSASGHAARANYLYAGAADLFLETGDTNFWSPLPAIWEDVTTRKMYVNGGCGALYDGASPDAAKTQTNITRVHQAYGRNYQLPNTTAHSETCANIGNVMWNWRMFRATGEARFLDVAELALYNSVLSGASLDGTNFFYTNPLRVTDPLPVELRWKRTRVPFVSSFCCPPNLARTIAELGSCAYAKSNATIWVNLYASSALATEIPGVGNVKLAQETDYPWSGHVKISVDETGGKEFALKLRLPGWARGGTVSVNRRRFDCELGADGFITLRRAWKAGDVVDFDLPMPARPLEANPLVEEDAGQIAVQRGPIVYCLESPDLPAGTKLGEIEIPSDIKLTPRAEKNLLGGIVALEGAARARTGGSWTNAALYRELQPTTTKPVAVRFIPYFTWANRGASEMSVWLPLEHEHEHND
jgi:DUF1680 family protein